MRGRVLMALAIAAAITAACDDSTDPDDDTITYTATLTGSAERPNPVTTSGTGTFTGTLDTETDIFTWTLTFSGLGSNTTGAHIHGAATPDQAVGVVVDFNQPPTRTVTLGATSGTANGAATLTSAVQLSTAVNGAQFRAMLDAGLTYVNVHTTTNPGGEIRGTITRQP